MPVRPTYPGVYIEEIPSGIRTIGGVATSIAAFMGTFRKGLLNEAVQIFSMADFEREYGGLDRTSETSYAVQQFFLNGGTEAWVVRLAEGDPASPSPNDAKSATVVLRSEPATTSDEVFRVRAGRRIRGASADNPGTWGNAIRVEVDPDTADPAELFNLSVSEVGIEGDRTIVLQSETFRNLTMQPDTPNNAIEVVNQSSRLVQLDRTKDGSEPLTPATIPAAPFRPAVNGTLGKPLPTPAVFPPHNSNLNIDVGLPAPIPGKIKYPGTPPKPPNNYAELLQFVKAAIQSAANDAAVPDGLKPLLSGATVKLIGDSTVNNGACFFVQLGRAARPFEPNRQISFTGAAATAIRLHENQAVENVQQHVLAGGHDGPPPAAGTSHRPLPVRFFQGDENARTGLHALEDVDLFNVLCLPEATTLSPAEMRTVYSSAEDYVERRRAMLIVDIPENVRTLNHMQTWVTENESLRHPNAAVYFPRTNIADPLNRNRSRSIASSGTIAGLWARTDTQRGVWKAPAGTEARLRNIESLDYPLTDQENGALNPLGVNCLRNFPIYSNICWGARTLVGADVIASDWTYVSVRRLTLFLEESLFRGSKWIVFESNDEELRAQTRLNIGAFMQDMFRKGAFQGTTPQDAYFVKCDSETTTQQDIDRGIVNIEVGFAPLKPAEFVIIKIQQMARLPEA